MSRLWWIFRATLFSGVYFLRGWPWHRRWEIAASVYDNTPDDWRGSPADDMREEFSCWQE